MVLIILLLPSRQSALLRCCPLAGKGGEGYRYNSVSSMFTMLLFHTVADMHTWTWVTKCNKNIPAICCAQRCYLVNALLVPDIHLGVVFLPLGWFSLMLQCRLCRSKVPRSLHDVLWNMRVDISEHITQPLLQCCCMSSSTITTSVTSVWWYCLTLTFYLWDGQLGCPALKPH